MVRFIFGIHNHQPLGNLDWVIKNAAERCYIPFLEKVSNFPFFKFTLHTSGLLIDWFEKNEPLYLELVEKLIKNGQVEILSGGYYEPLLASLPKRDRRKQISLLSQYIKKRFNIKPNGIWLTERVWEPDIIEDITRAGLRYVLVDDRHFIVIGFSPEELHSYYISEFNEKRIAIFPIDAKLRYLIPFGQPAKIEEYLNKLNEAGSPMAIYVDDGEKFGEWPGTHKWVYEDGWLDRFLETMAKLNEDGKIKFTTPGEVLKDCPAQGIAYLPNASYSEMEEWALPAKKIVELKSLRKRTGASPYIRGGEWKNFFVKYPESNRMHKFMLVLSSIVNKEKNMKAQKSLLLSQCNDAYWHGVFGGLYLPHLRYEIWKQLSETLNTLNSNMDGKTMETLDFDYDGKEEIWVHSKRFSSIFKPTCGGQLIQHILFSAKNNYQNTLTRRFEAYHKKITDAVLEKDIESQSKNETQKIPSIHNIKKDIKEPPQLFYDWYERNSFIDHFFSEKATVEDYEKCDFFEMGDFVNQKYDFEIENGIIVLTRKGGIYKSNTLISRLYLTKIFRLTDGNINCHYAIKNIGENFINTRFGIEFNLFPTFLVTGGGGIEIKNETVALFKKSYYEDLNSIILYDEKQNLRFGIETSRNCNLFYFPVKTVSQSEKGFDTTTQCLSFLPFWKLELAPNSIFEIDIDWRFERQSK